MRPSTAFATALAVKAASAASYSVVKEYSGSTFFDDWDFYGSFDNLTNGDAIFVSRDAASSLAYVDGNGHAIIKVDNTTNVPWNEKRNTVRIASKDRFDLGSVWVADMYHVPYGCSVWPAFWSQAPGWPNGGEIDTFEGVNLATLNQMALHTTSGCTQVDPSQSSTLINSTNCDFEANSNEGCVVTDPSPQSYGEAFAAAGGGVWVTEMSKEDGINIWFFPRSSVPDSVKNKGDSLDTSTLGTPVANWPVDGCDTSKFFEAQHLIFDITLCGDFAGEPSVFAQTCPGTCYTDYVVGNGSVYNNAWFDVDYVRVYGSGSGSVVEGDGAFSISQGTSWLAAAVALVGTAFVI